MIQPAGKQAFVLGRDASGEAAVALLRARGATVTWLPADVETPEEVPDPDFVVVSAEAGSNVPIARTAASRRIPVLGERELAFQLGLCLHVAVTGGSGKSTTAQMIAQILRGAGRRVEVASVPERPACALVEVSRNLDFLVHVVAPAELEHLQTFRPVVGVLLNAPSDHPGTEESWDDHVRRLARLFAVQQAFDWAIVQSEALAHVQSVGVKLPGKLITFSATSRQADLRAERGLLISRLEGWSGPLWDLSRGRMNGAHFAEDALAALAVGRVLRLTLEQMLPALETFQPGPGRLEYLGEADGVRYYDDSRAANLDSLARALNTVAPLPENPMVWLLAGGAQGGRQFYDLGPVISPRVKQAFLFGEAGPSMRAAWSLFTPCSLVASLLDAANKAMAQAERGDVVLYSPACPNRDQNLSSHSGAPGFREAVLRHVKVQSSPPHPGADSMATAR